MKTIALAIHCPCGGKVTRLSDDGVYYVLTENHDIVLGGRCNKCNDVVAVRRPILSLIMLCPNDDDKKSN